MLVILPVSTAPTAHTVPNAMQFTSGWQDNAYNVLQDSTTALTI